MDEAIGFEEEQDAADALAFALGGTETTRRDRRPPVLEVWHVWGNAVLDARRFPDASRAVVLGARSGQRWRFLGVDMGFVPDPLRHLLPAVSPGWSEVDGAWRSDFVVPELPDEEEWALFVPGEAGPVARIPAGWTATGWFGAERKTLADLVAMGRAVAGAVTEVTMAPDLKLVIEGGGARFIARMGPSEAYVARDDEVEPGFLALVGMGGFLFGMVAVLAHLGEPKASADTAPLDSRLVELLLERPQPKPVGKAPEAGSPKGAPAKEPEGRTGRKEAELEHARGAKRETRKLEMDRKVAESAGVLGAWADEGMHQVIGPTGLADLTEGIGGVTGDHGVQRGSDGLGQRGDWTGGGGEDERLGGLGTKPGGDGNGDWGSEGGDLGDKDDGVIAAPGQPFILGNPLDAALIDEVVKRNLPAIRYCYQRELPKEPTLGGDLVIKFSIAKDGSVSSAEVKASSLGHAGVESCVVGRFLRMQFPEPRGGALVIVSYPFTFMAGR